MHAPFFYRCPPDVLFPYGLGESDDFMPTTVDGNSGELPITVSFPFFDKDHDSLFVSTHVPFHFAKLFPITPEV